MKDSLLRELADTWELMAVMDKTEGNEAGRVVLRSCADTLRMMLDAPVVRLAQQVEDQEREVVMLRALRSIARSMGSDWPETCKRNVQMAREALSMIGDEGLPR